LRIDRFWDAEEISLDLSGRRRPDDRSRLALSVLVGPNGAGKSRVLEHLGRIFRCLADGVRSEISYEVEYEHRGKRILVTTREPDLGLPDAISRSRIDQLGVWLLIAQRNQIGWGVAALLDRMPSDPQTWLPVVVGISSGPVSRLDSALNPRNARFTEDAPGTVELDDGPNVAALTALDQPRCIAVSAPELRLAVLALMSHPRPLAPDAPWRTLRNEAGIAEAGIIGFSFEIDERYGQMLVASDAERLGQLQQEAARKVVVTPSNSSSHDPLEPNTRVAFDTGPELAKTIGELSADPLIWFHHLLRWQRRGAVKGVHLVLRKTDRLGVMLDDELSDGQFLLLGRYALLTLLSIEGGLLVLMDEPETHFNDLWKALLIDQLAKTLGDGSEDNEVVIATHSELTLTDAGRDEVFLISNNEIRGAPISTFAADREEITGSLVGADAATGVLSQRMIEEALESVNDDELRAMLDRVGPGYQRFRLRYALRQRTNRAS
jgi:energy-coupling factor transporter ATP-binding protein EcfA2